MKNRPQLEYIDDEKRIEDERVLFNVEVQLNEYRQLKAKTEYTIALNVIKELNLDYADQYGKFFIAPRRISEYNKALRNM